MQTFLPSSNFKHCVEVLDNKRLGKQRVECNQILQALRDKASGDIYSDKLKKDGTPRLKSWINHPAVLMWEGYEDALKEYYNWCLTEWEFRGFNNNMAYEPAPLQIQSPPWLGDEKIHSSHRSNLIRKDKEFYGKFGWIEDGSQPYYWPARKTD